MPARFSPSSFRLNEKRGEGGALISALFPSHLPQSGHSMRVAHARANHWVRQRDANRPAGRCIIDLFDNFHFLSRFIRFEILRQIEMTLSKLNVGGGEGFS
jgi:hypothetical protein